ncbi:hypothetical protein [Cupriavidus necator]
MGPNDVIAAFERMALGDQELPVDDAVAGLAQMLADEKMPEEMRVALLAGGATLYGVGGLTRGCAGRKKARRCAGFGRDQSINACFVDSRETLNAIICFSVSARSFWSSRRQINSESKVGKTQP